MVFYGQGGYDYDTVYNMPIWLRKFTHSRIKEHYEQLQQQKKKAEESWVKGSAKDKAKENTKKYTPPDYVTKTSKKS